jgi:hypothetical protein
MSKRLLSKLQIQQLGIAATRAFEVQEKLGLVEMPGDMKGASKSARSEFWRHTQTAEVTQRVCSFKEVIDDEYLKVKQHFEALGGKSVQAKATATTVRLVGQAPCHREPGCEYVRAMCDWMRKAGFGEGYMIWLMKRKFAGETKLENLTEGQLKQLHDTLVNRCRAKLGLGRTGARNKKQRRSFGQD